MQVLTQSLCGFKRSERLLSEYSTGASVTTLDSTVTKKKTAILAIYTQFFANKLNVSLLIASEFGFLPKSVSLLRPTQETKLGYP